MEAQKHEYTNSVDDLVSFIDGGDGGNLSVLYKYLFTALNKW